MTRASLEKLIAIVKRVFILTIQSPFSTIQHVLFLFGMNRIDLCQIKLTNENEDYNYTFNINKQYKLDCPDND